MTNRVQLQDLDVLGVYNLVASGLGKPIAQILKHNGVDGKLFVSLTNEDIHDLFKHLGFRERKEFRDFWSTTLAKANISPVRSSICKMPPPMPPPPYSRVNPKGAEMVPVPKRRMSVAQNLIKLCVQVSHGPPKVYHLRPLKVKEDKKNLIASFQLGKRNLRTESYPHKVLMMVGATGTGKSTLINALTNHFLGVTFEDHFRFQLISPEDEGGKKQTHSQTSWVNAYIFMPHPNSGVPYRLTIIDTPGYGDTRGIAQDQSITAQIKAFFSSKDIGVDHINGVAIVVKASDTRLTDAQKYIFGSILNIFGRDMESSIMIIATHADSTKILALDALKESNVPINPSLTFPVNNNALYERNISRDDDDDDSTEIFRITWNKNTKKYKEICSCLQAMGDASLWLTQENLQEREVLQVTMEDIKENLKQGVVMAAEIKKTEDLVEKQQALRDKHKDYTYTVPVRKKVKKPYLITLTAFNCTKCEMSCHPLCSLTWGIKRTCKMMSITGKCKRCECGGQHHKLQNFQYTTVVENQKRIALDDAKKFASAQMGLSASAIVLQALQREHLTLLKQNILLLRKAKQCLKRIEDISLSKTAITETGYIDLMIQNEITKKAEGWQDRIKALNELKKKTEVINSIGDIDDDDLDKLLQKMVLE
jgi:GTP-binding protein EngB required for normal cell division